MPRTMCIPAICRSARLLYEGKKLEEKRTKNNDSKYIGMKFGRLTVVEIKELGNKNRPYIRWDCKCDCGKMVLDKIPSKIKSGNCLSCGCLKEEQNKHNLGESRRKHGMSETRIYGIWEKMRDRCNREKCPAYVHYGGRGIKVCEAWDKDFMTFYEWAMSHGYAEDLTIERKDVNKGYNPENCCWIPREDQGRNKTNLIYVTINGEKMPLKTACEQIGMPYKAVHLRIKRRGWTIERALTEPIYDNRNSVKSKCKAFNMPYNTVIWRLNSGWSEERAFNTPVRSRVKPTLDGSGNNV